MSHGQCYSLLYALALSQEPARNSCFRDTTTIILASSNRENEIEMHSACLRPLSRPPGSSGRPVFVERKPVAGDAGRLCSSTTFKYIHSHVLCLPYLPKNFVDPVNCSSALILFAESTSSAEATKRNDRICRKV